MSTLCKCGICALDCEYHRPEKMKPWAHLHGECLDLSSGVKFCFTGLPRDEWLDFVHQRRAAGAVTDADVQEATKLLDPHTYPTPLSADDYIIRSDTSDAYEVRFGFYGYLLTTTAYI